MSGSVRLLLVGQAPELREAAREAGSLGADVRVTPNVATSLEWLRQDSVDLVLADVVLDVATLIRSARAERVMVPVLACGVHAPAELAVAAIRAGAADYVPLPPDRSLIAAVLMTVGERATDLVGDHPDFVAALEHARRFASTALPMLILGEAGTGKETLARLVHRWSGRTGPFLTVDAAGVAEQLLESELFGHAQGAFSDALDRRLGKLNAANRGTLFVHHIDALPSRLQGRLAGALPVSGARVIASSSTPVGGEAQPSALRADLLASVGVVRCGLPPLRDRRQDIPKLAEHFCQRLSIRHSLPPCRLSDRALRDLRDYAWPGNVREMEQVVQRALVLAQGDTIRGTDLVLASGRNLRTSPDGSPPPLPSSLIGQSVDVVERQLILATLQQCGGNRTVASGILGISIRTMRNKLRLFAEAGHFPVAAA